MFKKVACCVLLSVVMAIGGHCRANQAPKQLGIVHEFQRLTASTTIMLPTINVSSACAQQTHVVMEEAERFNLWALKILDATAKLPSGILSGNVNQFGDFDLCLEAIGDNENSHIRGRYCLADFNIVPSDEKYKLIDDRSHSYRPLTSDIDDIPQRVPKKSSWRWGVCMPSACTPQDLKGHIIQALTQTLTLSTKVEVHVDPDACYTAQKTSLTIGHYVAITLLMFLTMSIIWGTIQDKTRQQVPQYTALGNFFHCFSLTKNWNKLKDTDNFTEDIDYIHGLRGLNAIILYFSHKCMAYMFTPLTNAATFAEDTRGVWTMGTRSSFLYTDSFLFISGLLAARSAIKELDKSGRLNVTRNFISRYIRFTPSLLVVILVSTYLTDFIGSGPLWGFVVGKYSTLCKCSMWKNLLYIHNYDGWENMCLSNSHHLALEMQLFLISPILVYLIWKFPKLGVMCALTLAGVSSWLRYSMAIEKEINYVIHYGIPMKQMMATGRFSYSVATHRATVYIVAILFAFAMQRGYTAFNISKAAAKVGWAACSAAMILATSWFTDMSERGYEFDSHSAALNNTFAPIVWCLGLTWIGIACTNGKGGWMNTILTWKYFRIFSRVSYAFYLVQFPIFFYFVGTLRYSQTYLSLLTFIDINELLTVIGASVLLTLGIDFPCQNLKTTFWPSVQEKQTKAKVT